ncbi:MAG: rhomboid family intramembrane serine protease [Candidatus Aenigmarchaeota archaeon]|nr:rhomboid family intramembrane serine protease [Candidatus Aenigmarchaeota archaeon]
MKLTLLLILLCVAVYLYPFLFIGNEAGINNFYETYGFSGKNMVERPYVLVTSIFLHDPTNIVHLLSNIFVLFFFGMAVEKEIGSARMLAIFLLGSFLGDLMSLLVYSFDSIAVGASAGIFALIGAGILLRPIDLSFAPFIIPMPLALLGAFYAFYNFYGFIAEPTGNVSYIAHFGGLFVGLTYGFKKTGIKKGMKIIMIALTALIAIKILLTMLVK